MSIVLLSHGSRHPRAAAGLAELRQEVETLSAQPTRLAYLDLQYPRVRQVAQPGDTVVPLLFTDAFHVRHDVPAATRDLGVCVTAPLGTGHDLAVTMAEQVAAPNAVLYAVGSSVPGANEAIFELARSISDLSGSEISVAFATCAPRFTAHPDTQVIPLFVTHGLLLDRLASAVRVVPAPLAHALAPIVVSRWKDSHE